MDDNRSTDGMRMRRRVLGDEHVDRAIAGTTPFSAPFQQHITEVAWGSVWTRDQLDHRTRSCLTLALLAALGHEEELAMHVRTAIRLGLTAEEIGEVLLHTSVYAGIPAANSAMRVAQHTLADLGVEEALPQPMHDTDTGPRPPAAPSDNEVTP